MCTYIHIQYSCHIWYIPLRWCQMFWSKLKDPVKIWNGLLEIWLRVARLISRWVRCCLWNQGAFLGLTRCLSLCGQIAQAVYLWFWLFFSDAHAVTFLLGGQCADQVVLASTQSLTWNMQSLLVAWWRYPLLKQNGSYHSHKVKCPKILAAKKAQETCLDPSFWRRWF